ncbi:uncharacterized protein LOC128346006 [Hemicordylus capensis]|uniref:uncharacterized protein LOC128346006 n=1 Tax=Hemicordylus capensis TaxID=884348 RepID=UPI002303F0B4|nr:uncharacterized protein LOC128346006 [Hemicordylus capensis]
MAAAILSPIAIPPAASEKTLVTDQAAVLSVRQQAMTQETVRVGGNLESLTCAPNGGNVHSGDVIIGPNNEHISPTELRWLGDFVKKQCLSLFEPPASAGVNLVPYTSSGVQSAPTNADMTVNSVIPVLPRPPTHSCRRPFSSSPDSSPARRAIPMGERAVFQRPCKRYKHRKETMEPYSSGDAAQKLARPRVLIQGDTTVPVAVPSNNPLADTQSLSMPPVAAPGPLPASTGHRPHHSDSTSSDEEKEGGELSDEQNLPEKPNTVRLFPAAEFELLLTKVKRAIKDVTTTVDNPQVSALNQEVFPSTLVSAATVPFPSLFKEVMLAEWGVPVAHKPAISFPKKLYSLPPDMFLLAVPVVDAPVAQLVSGALLNKEGDEFLKAREEKKAGHLLRKAHEASATVIRAATTNSVFAGASVLWNKQLAKLVPPENVKLCQERLIDSQMLAMEMVSGTETNSDLPSDNLGVNPGETKTEAAPRIDQDPSQALRMDGTVSSDSIPVRGRLQEFASVWRESSSDLWVLQTLSQGHKIDLISHPPDFFFETPVSKVQTKQLLMDQAIQHLLEIKAIESIQPTEMGTGVFSLLFLIPKRDGSWRAVLNLKRLNRFVKKRSFRMESLRTIKAAIHPGNWLASTDLSEAYLHVPIHPASRRYLHFSYNQKCYQYRALPFGLTSAPRVFTKLMVAVIAHIRQEGIHAYPYLDDVLLQSLNYRQATRDLSRTVHIMESHGFIINRAKSHLQPSQLLQHLEVLFDTQRATVSLPPERQMKIAKAIRPWLSRRKGTVMSLAQILVLMIACLECTPWARWHPRPLQ